MKFQKGQPSANPAGRKRNRYPARIYWEEVKQTLGLSTLDLARELGVCVRTVECWERGEKNYRGAAKRPPPPVMILVKKLLLIHELIGDINATVHGKIEQEVNATLPRDAWFQSKPQDDP